MDLFSIPHNSSFWMKTCFFDVDLPQALSINPRSLMASLESIEACGVTLTEPLRTWDGGDQPADQPLTPEDEHSSLKTKSNSRLALAAKTIGKYRNQPKKLVSGKMV